MSCCSACNRDHPLQHRAVGTMDSEWRRWQRLPARHWNSRIEFPMVIDNTAIQKTWLFTAKDVDRLVGNGLGSSARRLRETRSRLPKVLGGIVNVDACK